MLETVRGGSAMSNGEQFPGISQKVFKVALIVVDNARVFPVFRQLEKMKGLSCLN